MKKISFLFGMLATCITLQAAVEEISVSRALEITSALADGASTTEQYIVKGVVSEINTTDEGLVTYKNCDFWMRDSDNATLKLKAFRTNGINGAAFTVGLIAVGDTVRVQGVLMNYVNTTTSERLSEIYKGNLVEVVAGNSGGGETGGSNSGGGETDGIYYNFDDANLTATVTYRGSDPDAYTNEYTGEVVIPTTVTYDGKTYSVTSIGEYAFKDCSSLTSVTIPNSVTSIGAVAFFDCRSLTSITIPNSVTSIGASAFEACSGLTEVTIGNSVTSIGAYAFNACSVLWSITIPNSVTSIGTYAFDGTAWLENQPDGVIYINQLLYTYNGKTNLPPNTSIVVREGTTQICDYAFSGCTGLLSITIPNSVTSIGAYAFNGCQILTSVTIPTSVESIGSGAFSDCSGLTSVVWNAKNCADFSSSSPFSSSITSFTFGTEVEHIPAYLCDGQSSLNAVTIPNSVTSIGEYAFYGCSGLTSITIPNSVTSIGYRAFHYCTGLTQTYYMGNISDWCGIAFANWSSNPAALSHNLYINNVEVKDLVIPDGVTSIGGCAFDNCNITSVTIPASVTNIGISAFYGCTALREITALPTAPPTCGSDAFYNVPADATLRCSCESREAYQTADTWSRFTEIRPAIPNITLLTTEEQGSVQVDERIFCESKSVVISATPQIGYAFARWSDGNTENPRTVLLAHDTTLTAEFGLAYSGKCGDNLYWEYKQNKLLITGSGDMYDFTAETQPWKFLLADIESVETSAGTTSVGASAFAGCSGLTSVVWNAKNCADFSSSPFSSSSCSYITFTFGNAVEHIPAYLCYDMENLTSITIPNSVTSIGEYAFYGCSSLTSVIIPNSVTSIEYGTFALCSGLTSVTIGNSVTSIGDWAFQDCSGLASVTIPSSVTSIGGYAFSGCSGLTSVTIGNSVKSIGSSAFAGCTKLINIVCYAAEPPSCDASAFANYNVFLKVPCDNLMAYQTHVCWGSFKYISCIGSDEVQVTEFSVTPSVNDALFTWPAESGAATYELVISKDGVVFCTLTFNANGQLMGIAFAPSANAPAAAPTTSGFQFTVTGLVAASHYTYTFDAKDAGGNVIKHYAGEFNTEGSTVGLEQIELANIYTQDGRIVCEGEFRIYDLLGRDVTRLNGSLCGVYVVKSGNAAVKVVVK